MQLVQRTAIQSHLAVGDYDRRIILGYVVIAIVALIAVYFASGGSGVTETELSIATVLP